MRFFHEDGTYWITVTRLDGQPLPDAMRIGTWTFVNQGDHYRAVSGDVALCLFGDPGRTVTVHENGVSNL